MDPVERRVLGALCDQLPQLRAQCAEEPEDRRLILSRIEAEARARRPVLALLGELLGTSPAGTVRGLGRGLPGAGTGHADEESFGCPDRACDRVALGAPAGAAPSCRLTGLPMVRR